jgi:hypothetical protein
MIAFCVPDSDPDFEEPTCISSSLHQAIHVQPGSIQSVRLAGGWLLMTGAGLFREKSTAGWWLVCSERKVLLTGG